MAETTVNLNKQASVDVDINEIKFYTEGDQVIIKNTSGIMGEILRAAFGTGHFKDFIQDNPGYLEEYLKEEGIVNVL